jgi:Glyoxalase-like domain
VTAVAYDFQVAFDCADPHGLADWWAETLGWTVEEQDPDFIRRMIAEGYATEADTTMHDGGWSGARAPPSGTPTDRMPDRASGSSSSSCR